MKRSCWLIFGTLFSMSLLGQQATNTTRIETPGAAPAVTNAAPASADTNAPSAKAEKKPSKKKLAKGAGKKKPVTTEVRTVPLVPGPAVVAASHVNVRGRAGLKGEVINHLTNGEPVTILEEVTLKNSGPDEPSAWAKITLPVSTRVWVNSSFLDGTNKTVRPKKLNVRGGPGENYSVLGTLKQGEAVKEVGAKGEWLQIEPPADAYAFVAAQYLKQESPATSVATATPEPATNATTVAEAAPPVVAAPVETPTAAPPPAETVTNAPGEAASAPATVIEEPPPPRIVQREGIVRGTFSIQAPTHFELISPDNGKTINYLYTTARDLDLRRYKGIRIIVTGEEALDERWHNTPVITIQKIQVIE